MFENLVAWGSRSGLKLWRGSKTTRVVCAGDYSLQAPFFTNNFEILLFALQTSKLHENGFCVCGGFIARKHATALLLGLARLQNEVHITKWDSENTKQAKYFENGNSNKWDLG